jgi:signal transduction histidine kinase
MRPEQILDRAPTGIISLGPEDRIQFVNQFAARMLGCASADELLGQPIRSYIQFLGADTSGEELCVRDDGTSFPIAYESAPLIENGHVAGAVLSLRDMTQQRAADKRQAELVSIVSHELRTPLTSIRSALGLLASGLLGRTSDQGQEMLDIAVNNTDRLIRMLSDLLDLERLNSGQSNLRREVTSAVELLHAAADSVRSMAEEANVSIVVPPTEVKLVADPDRLLQVLINLLANAIKFSPEQGGSVWLDAEQLPGEVVFRVRDEGRGIPAEKLELIFERFAQVDEADSRRKGGIGLGLAISRAIVQQHGGQIWAESRLGVGTTLCVAFPLEEVGAPALRNAA